MADSENRAAFLPGLTSSVLIELCDKCELEVDVVEMGDGLFLLIGGLDQIQSLFSEAQSHVSGIAALYSNVAVAQASLMPV